MTGSGISSEDSLAIIDATRPIVERETIKSPFKGDKLDKDTANWVPWRREVQNYLDMIGLSSHLTESLSSPPSSINQPNAYRNWISNNRSVRGYIKSAIAKTEHELIDNLDRAHQCWSALSDYHLDEGPIKQANLIQGALAMRIDRDDKMIVKLRQIRDDLNRAFEMKGGIDKNTFICIVALQALGVGLDHSRAIIQRDMSSSSPSSPYTPDHFIKFMEQEYQMLMGEKQRGTNSDAIALAAQGSAKGKQMPTCSNCKRPGHSAQWCIRPGGGMAGKTIEESKDARRKDRGSKSGSTNSSGPTPTTSSARVPVSVKGQDGRAYLMLMDPSSLTPIVDSAQQPAAFAGIASISADSITTDDIEYHGFMATIQEEPIEPVGGHKANVDWNLHSKAVNATTDTTSQVLISSDVSPFFIDSGASSGISPHKSDFMNLHPYTRQVKGIGGSVIDAYGIGDIRLKITKNTELILKNSLYIPGATVRLISVSSVTRDSNVLVHFDSQSCWITDKFSSTTLARGTLVPTKNLYALTTHAPQHEHAYSLAHSPNLSTWHRRLGHANFQAIFTMARKGMIAGMPLSPHDKPPKCDSCILGKQTKTPIPKVRETGEGHRATRRLGKVWVDLTGPMSIQSRTGNNYIMNIVDDFTNYPWSIPLKNKNEAYQYLKAWEAARENETGLKVGLYNIDNGELKSEDVKTWLESRGTQLRFTAPYTSAHNGRVERMHRTLMEKARTMRLYADLPANLWDELYLTASHIHAKTPTRSLKEITPFELWHGRKPDYSYMREIGCKAFVLIQNRHNPKIYERSIECILIGYDTNSKSYRCYHKPTKRVISSYHVRFLESHEGHNPPLPKSTPTTNNLSTLSEIIDSATNVPIIDPEEHTDQDLDVKNRINPSISINDNIIDPVTDQIIDAEESQETDVPPDMPDEPRRSSRIPTKTSSKSDGIVKSSRLEEAIRQSKESAQRKAAERQEQRENKLQTQPNPINVNDPSIEDLCDAVDHLTISEDNTKEIDDILAAISNLPQADLENFNLDEPNTWNEAKASSYSEQWEIGYREELQSLKDMGVYRLLHRSQVPAGSKIRKGRPVFRLKRDADGKPVRWKVRLVFKGFEQVYGKDYTSTTSPTARMESWRILLHIAATNDWDAQQIDVKTAFLYGLLPDSEIQYMEQPLGFEEKGKEDYVWVLQRGLYGMKQSGRIWNQTMNDAMLSWGFTRLSCESCIYYRKTSTGTVISVVHVDDFLSVATSKAENESFKTQMKSLWTISDLGEAKHCVGIAISRNVQKRTVSLSQKALIDKIVQQFGQSDSYKVSTPMDPGLKLRQIDKSSLSKQDIEKLAKIPYRSLVGCLIYLAVGTRPDISYSVQQLSQFLDCFSYAHWNAAIRVVRYLKGSRDLELILGGDNDIRITGFTDSDWANCPDTRRSVGGFLFTLGSGPVSWQSKRQRTVATSSCEAEYTAAFEASKEAIWLRTLLSSIGLSPTSATTLLCDNIAAITLSEDPAFHARVKHFDIRYHFLRERVQSGDISLSYINTKDNIADIFTKPLDTTVFTRLRTFLGLL